jgi:hypothetical protein
MLGHKTIQAHEVYNAFDREDAMAAYEKLEQSLALVRQGEKGAYAP